MALITCPDCGTQVSSEAEACRQCGRPIRKSASAGGDSVASGVFRGIGGCVILPLVLFILFLTLLVANEEGKPAYFLVPAFAAAFFYRWLLRRRS